MRKADQSELSDAEGSCLELHLPAPKADEDARRRLKLQVYLVGQVMEYSRCQRPRQELV